ncbi:hypothetical protein GT204_23320 [Streptomyces sp. SID4919]|uniref:hypothetical protein n=1 Tax=unclassified Streptomyces TaxID=2593676 RepID=UPI000823D936|nr:MULTISPECIES: hypothetical protein [unclassified Streptomyces]MYY11756.1 hypothetical protein [Streptomyces sp. SID4919]SCK11509.1 hypothetical protein YW7DRAFT_00631 [Streptomyces sp. AmelKG-E11A]
MLRNVLGSVLALLGATAAVWSPFRAWYDGRLGRYYEVGELFTGHGVTDARSALFLSLFLPFLVAAVLTLVGVALRSRTAVALAGLIVLGFTVLWMVRLGLALGELTVNGDGTGLGWGALAGLGGGLVMLLGATLMPGRRARPTPTPHPADTAPPAPYPPPPDTRYDDSAPTRTWNTPPDTPGPRPPDQH